MGLLGDAGFLLAGQRVKKLMGRRDNFSILSVCREWKRWTVADLERCEASSTGGQIQPVRSQTGTPDKLLVWGQNHHTVALSLPSLAIHSNWDWLPSVCTKPPEGSAVPTPLPPPQEGAADDPAKAPRPYSVDVFSVRNHPDSAPPASHGCDQAPLINLGIVYFGGEQALVPVEAATDIDLLGSKEGKKASIN